MQNVHFAECPECHKYYEPSFTSKVGDYLTDIASAITSLFKRIFGMDDPITTQDMLWAGSKNTHLRHENTQLKQRVKYLEKTQQKALQLEIENSYLQGRIGQLERDAQIQHQRNNLSWTEALSVEIVAFCILPPLYVMALPVIAFRSALYNSIKETHAQKLYL